jgi:ubiquinone/menaquinone biosynthesis C-methylase UbiE
LLGYFSRQEWIDMDALLGALRATADRSRLRLLALAGRAELSVGELAEILGQSQPRVSRHIKLLCEAGLLDRTREGPYAFIRVRRQGPVAALAQALAALMPEDDPELAADRSRLAVIQATRANEAAEYFRRNAPQWDRLRSLYVEEAEVERALLGLFPAGQSRQLLDIGTGSGSILRILADRIEHGVGLDSSREMLAVARAELSRAGRVNCALKQGDMYRLPWGEAAFDAVTIHQVLHFAEVPAAAVTEAARVLRPGGRMVIVDFAPHGLEFLRAEHAHRWLGFAEHEVSAWLAQAGLVPAPPILFQGESLTVIIWAADRPPQDDRSKAAA